MSEPKSPDRSIQQTTVARQQLQAAFAKPDSLVEVERCLQTLSEAGWTHQAIYNIPNALSMARLVSGPVIAWLILNEQWGVALVSLAISGASDWADG